MNNSEIETTLGEIKNLMERSAKVMYLNGSSAIIVGCAALLSAITASWVLYGNFEIFTLHPSKGIFHMLSFNEKFFIFALAASLMIFSATVVILMSKRKAERLNIKFKFDGVTKKLIISFLIPLGISGLLCLTNISEGRYDVIASDMLIFYGISLINISLHTYSNTKYLGVGQIIIGLTDSLLPGHSLLFWTLGFGLLHIIYGIYFYCCIEKTNKTI